jgi:flagellar biosynthesis protein FliR
MNEIIPQVSTVFVSFVVIGGLVLMACIFAAILPRVLDGLFED